MSHRTLVRTAGVFVLACVVSVMAMAADEPKAVEPQAALLERIATLEKRVAELEDRYKLHERVRELEEQLAEFEKPKPVEIDYKPTELDGNVAKKLEDSIPVNFEANKLVHILDYYRNTTGINMFVDWARLEEAGVEIDQPVSLRLGNTPAGKSLKIVLHDASANSEPEPVDYMIMDGIVIISTKKGLARYAEQKVRLKK
jgi:hypothetical protein